MMAASTTGKGARDKYNKFWSLYDPKYYEAFEKRCRGLLPEMESSKSVAKLIKRLSAGKEVSLLDAGCGMGHYYVSLKKRVKMSRYEGCDVTRPYVDRANEIWREEPISFRQAQIGELPYRRKNFDLVMCNNVLLHIPPPVFPAVKDLMRVSRKLTVIRTPLADRTYFVKELRNFDPAVEKKRKVNIKTLDDTRGVYNYFNLYEKSYIDEMVRAAAKELKVPVKVTYERDRDFRKFDNAAASGSRTATRVVKGKQVSGALVLDWHYVIIEQLKG